MSSEADPNVSVWRIGSEAFLDHREEDAPRVYWWGITSGSLTYAAIGNSSMEAYQAVANSLGVTIEKFLMVPPFAELYSDEVQTELAAKFGERTVVRILAFSIVEWPDDINNLTDEQRDHCLKMGWLKPDGTWSD